MFVGVLVLAMVGPSMIAAARLRAPPPTTYYLALGDSLSTGGGADPGMGYVNDIDNRLTQSIPGLQLVDLGCGGDSTTRMIKGGLCHNYTTGNQLGDAEAFLEAHPGQVAFVTIDVGGDDIVGCALSGTINQTCVSNALTAVASNMQTILAGLRAAGGQVPIIGMNYYDPILAAWYSGAWEGGGPPNPALALASSSVLDSLNSELETAYQQYGARYADVADAFASDDWAMTGSYMGTTLPQNVANICNWTHMCMTGGGNPNIHTTDYGHSLIANAYESVMPPPIGTIVVLPSDGASLSGSPYLDAVSSPGVTQVQYDLSGGTLSGSVIGTATPTLFGWIAGWNTTTVPNGTYTLQSVASCRWDQCHQSGRHDHYCQPPACHLRGDPSNGSNQSGSEWLDASASSGVTSVNYVINGGPNDLVDTPISGSTPTYFGWIGAWSSTTVPNGSYTIQSVASYAGGVTGMSAPITVTVSN